MKVLAVNVSEPTIASYKGKEVTTGIYNKPVHGPVMVRETNIDGDRQADLENHGGVDKAVYAFPFEHYAFYQDYLELDEFGFGHFGENLTTDGLSEAAVRIGDRYRLGEAEFEVTQPRTPCFKFAMRMGTSEAAKVMMQSGKTGFYLRVIKEGLIDAGELVRSLANESAPTVEHVHQLMFFDLLDAGSLQNALDTPALAQGWRDAFASRLAKLGSASET
jgi:MOSC domain-containing protein YiiM